MPSPRDYSNSVSFFFYTLFRSDYRIMSNLVRLNCPVYGEEKSKPLTGRKVITRVLGLTQSPCYVLYTHGNVLIQYFPVEIDNGKTFAGLKIVVVGVG